MVQLARIVFLQVAAKYRFATFTGRSNAKQSLSLPPSLPKDRRISRSTSGPSVTKSKTAKSVIHRFTTCGEGSESCENWSTVWVSTVVNLEDFFETSLIKQHVCRHLSFHLQVSYNLGFSKNSLPHLLGNQQVQKPPQLDPLKGRLWKCWVSSFFASQFLVVVWVPFGIGSGCIMLLKCWVGAGL